MVAARVTPSLTLCVYCGSRQGSDPRYAVAARQVGHEIGRRGWQLVYGGGRAGLMGEVAEAALQAGARVIGVIPHSLMERELGHQELSELHVVSTMHERKKLMADHADAFLALPGGLGSFEELFEVWTWRQLGYHNKPLGLLNVAGYYDTLLTFLSQTVEKGFVWPEQHAFLTTSADSQLVLDGLAAQVGNSALQANRYDMT